MLPLFRCRDVAVAAERRQKPVLDRSERRSRIYNAFAKAEADRKLFRRFLLSDGADLELALSTLQLLTSETLAEKRIDTLWREQFVDRQVREAVVQMFRGAKFKID